MRDLSVWGSRTGRFPGGEKPIEGKVMAAEGSRVLRAVLLWMVLSAVAAAGAAWWYTKGLPDQFRARALIVLAPMPINEPTQERSRTQVELFTTEETPAPRFLRMDYFKSLPMPDYKLILTSEEMARRVRDHMRELYAARGMDGAGLTISGVQGAMDVQVKIYQQTYDEVQYQQVVELLLNGREPEIVADAVNFWADESVVYANEMRFAGRQGLLELFDKQVAETQTLLDQEVQAAAEIVKQGDPAEIQGRITAAEHQLKKLGGAVTHVTEAIAGAEGRIGFFESEQARAASDSESSADLAEALRDARAEKVSYQAQQELLSKEIPEREAALAALHAQMAEQKRLCDAHTSKIAVYRQQLEELEMGRYAARFAAAEATPEFKIVSRAPTPEGPTGPHRSLMVLVAIVLACGAAPVCYFGLYALRKYAAAIERDLASGRCAG